MKLVGVYSDPTRDPMEHVMSIAYLSKEIGGVLIATDDDKAVKVFKINEIPKDLAFDHAEILKDALRDR